MIVNRLLNPAMPGKIYEILDAQDRVLLEQPAASAEQALQEARKAFPYFASRFRVAIIKRKSELKPIRSKSILP